MVDYLEKKKDLMFCKPSTTFPEVLELLDQSSDTSLPVIVLKGKRKKLVGMVSAWDVLEKLVINMMVTGSDGNLKTICDESEADDRNADDAGSADKTENKEKAEKAENKEKTEKPDKTDKGDDSNHDTG